MNEWQIIKKLFKKMYIEKCEKKSDCIISMLLFNLNMYIKASISKQDKKKYINHTYNKKKVVHKRHIIHLYIFRIGLSCVGLVYFTIKLNKMNII